MKEQDKNLAAAIEKGNIELTQQLLSSGEEVPEKYKGKDSALLLINLKKPERKRSIMKVGGNDSGKLEEKIAKPISEMVGEANAFDEALENAVKVGFIKSESINLDDKKETLETRVETTDMLKKRWKLAAVLLNHYSSDDAMKVDLSSRFNSKKANGIENGDDPEIWKEAGNLIPSLHSVSVIHLSKYRMGSIVLILAFFETVILLPSCSCSVPSSCSSSLACVAMASTALRALVSGLPSELTMSKSCL